MALKGSSNVYRSLFLTRPYAAQAAAAKKAEHAEKISLGKEDVKTTTLPNGLIVTSVENHSPVSRLGVMVKAGPRYEPSNQLGLSHYLRSAAGLSTENFTSFGIVRNIEKIGGNFHVSSTRENILYELNCNRDHLDTSVQYLAEIVTKPNFFPWELSKPTYDPVEKPEVTVPSRMKVDLARHSSDPAGVLLEALHKASFQGGLRNSIYSPNFMIGKHSPEMLKNYTKETFKSNRVAIVGLGVDHGLLLDYVNNLFNFQTAQDSKEEVSKFKGGEVYIDADYPLTYAAVVSEGAGLKSQKDFLCLALLQKLLGDGPQVKYSASVASRLGAAAGKVTNRPFAVNALNIGYSTTGLFGFCVAANPEDTDKLIKVLLNEVRSLKNVTDPEISVAKQRLKSCLNMSLESQSRLLEEMAESALTSGQSVTASDVDKAVDAITAQDVTAVASRVLRGKTSIAALGQLHRTHFLDDQV